MNNNRFYDFYSNNNDDKVKFVYGGVANAYMGVGGRGGERLLYRSSVLYGFSYYLARLTYRTNFVSKTIKKKKK